ncbi:hypothetical protein V501_06145 [Pseudogymnoascus sp. VKM F-4519 (FW-2642)]|nr:hypothetical protein V501_06145 [Pseudogymnoascus sp. VKM F-4519 (FW-2642)]
MASTSSPSALEASQEPPPALTPNSELAAAEAATEKPPDDSSKLRMFLGILRKFIGVKDIASVRFSLPAQLLEPTPNLEYWTYLDRPETFTAIGDSDEPLDRMLEVLRFWFTKDLKYIKGKPCKPYNSTLGEFFRCNWEVAEAAPSIASLRASTPSSSKSSVKSTASAKSTSPAPKSTDEPIRISFLTEQTSHHPPVSAFYVECPAKGLSARGFDQLSAKFTGTSIKVTPGEHNLGIFITLHKRDDEQYQLTHPAAHLGGLLRGGLSVSVGDQCYTTCPKTRIKTILHYLEEGWLGKAQNRVEGVVFKYDPENDDKMRIADVPEKDVLARITGNWKEKVFVSFAPNFKTQIPIIDLTPLTLTPKILPPETSQLPNESLRYWSGVTEAITSRQFGRATVLKTEIEERQRRKAREREEGGIEWSPRFFVGSVTPLGRPELTADGEEALRRLGRAEWAIEESKVTAS